MNPNQVFCFAFAILPLQIIDMQQQQMFAFFILYQRWVNEYMQILNVAFLRRQWHLRKICVVPYTRTIPHSAELWFDIHYLNPVLLLRSFVVLFFFFFCQTLSWPEAGWAITLTTLAGLSDQLSKILLGPAWSKIGPANVGLKRQKFWLENDPSA